MIKPKVSVVVPVYNASAYLRTCLESALTQTLDDLEIICVNDGSTDDSPAILAEYAARDSRVRVIHQANGGYGRAVNAGMDAARGEYFAILEADDVIHPRMYETLYQIAEENRLDVVKADFCRFTVEDGVFRPVNAKIANSPALYGRVIEDDPALVLHEAALYTWSGIYHLNFLRQNHLRHNETPGASYQDNGFWFLTMAFARRVWFHDAVFYMLRRDNPASSTQSREKVYCVRDEYDYILRFLKESPAVYNRVRGVYWWARFGSYRWHLNRIAEEYKPEFTQHFYETMRAAADADELDYSLFSDKSWGDLDALLSDYHTFPDSRRATSQQERLRQKRTLLNRLRWCYEDNGFLYTARHLYERVLLVAGNRVRYKKNMEERVLRLENQMDRQKKEIAALKKRLETMERGKP